MTTTATLSAQAPSALHAPAIGFDHAGDGELVVLLHGVGADRRAWREQIDALCPDFHAVAWDARGYGLSGDYAGAFDFSEVCADLQRLMDHFDTPRAHLVGHSMGGLIAQDFYRRWPQRVRSLVLINSTRSLRSNMSASQLEEFVRVRVEPLRHGVHPRELAAAIVPRLLGGATSDDVRRRVQTMISDLRAENYAHAIEAVARFEPTLGLASVRVPTLVIAGEEDAITPPACSQELAAGIPQARYLLVPGAGHMANMEQPQIVNLALREFLLGAGSAYRQ